MEGKAGAQVPGGVDGRPRGSAQRQNHGGVEQSCGCGVVSLVRRHTSDSSSKECCLQAHGAVQQACRQAQAHVPNLAEPGPCPTHSSLGLACCNTAGAATQGMSDNRGDRGEKQAQSAAPLTNQQAQLRGPQPACVLPLKAAGLKQQQRGGGPAVKQVCGFEKAPWDAQWADGSGQAGAWICLLAGVAWQP